ASLGRLQTAAKPLALLPSALQERSGLLKPDLGISQMSAGFADGGGPLLGLTQVEQPQQDDAPQGAAEHVHHGQIEDRRDTMVRLNGSQAKYDTGHESADRMRRLRLLCRAAADGAFAEGSGMEASRCPRGSEPRCIRTARSCAERATASE